MHRLIFMFLTLCGSRDPKRSELLELTQRDHVSVNSNDFTVKSKLNGYTPLHFFYWAFKLLGF